MNLAYNISWKEMVDDEWMVQWQQQLKSFMTSKSINLWNKLLITPMNVLMKAAANGMNGMLAWSEWNGLCASGTWRYALFFWLQALELN